MFQHDSQAHIPDTNTNLPPTGYTVGYTFQKTRKIFLKVSCYTIATVHLLLGHPVNVGSVAV